MSEELIGKGLTESGIKVGDYEFYPIGDSTLNQLKKYKIIPQKDYRQYSNRKPDALLVDRRNKSNVKVILVIERKDIGKFKSKADRITTAQQCNDVCQELSAEVGIATDNTTFVWINPNHQDEANEYSDRTTQKKCSYSVIRNEAGVEFVREFITHLTQPRER